MDKTALDSRDDRWWAPLTLPCAHTLHCRVGPLAFQLQRERDECRIAWRHEDETEDATSAFVEIRAGGLDLEPFERFAFRETSDRVSLRPMLADRSVVVQPRQSLFLPRGEEATLYLSSPVYLSIEIGQPPAVLREVPTIVQSDTWFGPNTRDGELCYSGRTAARQSLAQVPRRVHRALTAVRIHNDAPSTLPLDRFSLPVPLLSVYGGPDGSLWTQSLSLVRSSHSDMAAVKIDKSPPREAGRVELVAGPRRSHERGNLVRAFAVLFGD